jgi:glutamate formiminotransferase
MDRLVECVPNVSEGRDAQTLSLIAAAMSGVAGAALLDQTADIDHARSVFTLAGHSDAVMDAMEQAMAVALERIDMRRQAGQHPRLGAVDVVPFVPLGDTTLADCAYIAATFAERVAERFELPIYLYGAAASRPERSVLAHVRQPGFEGLRAFLASADGAPDFGPRRPHPTAGATAVGARSFLIAWNIQLDSPDVAVARALASGIRERDGGLPGVQALGLELETLGCTQLSMNVLDHERTPLWRVWEEASALAARAGVAIIDSELIGLVPSGALDAVASHIGTDPIASSEERHALAGAWLRMRDFKPSRTVEARLARSRPPAADQNGSAAP